jgi:uncharacterized protein YhaN
VKITDLEIDGFGAWSRLRLDDLSEGLTVLFGPNEAGKTTLLQFIRSVFFGVSSDRQQYLPPLDGGPGGGAVGVALAEGRFQIRRRMELDPPGGRIEVHAEDGEVHDAALLETALQEVDEATFNNIFAIGLRELQELSTLTATEASAWLYQLTLGVDRVSLLDVMQQLAAARNRLIAPDDGPDEVTQLLAERSRCLAELDALPATANLWVDVSQRQLELERRIEEFKAERARLAGEVQRFEVAVEQRDRWQRRAALQQELAETSDSDRRLPPSGIARMERLAKRYQRLRDQRKRYAREYRRIRDEARQLTKSGVYARHAPRIELLADQLDWVAALEGQLEGHRQELAGLASELDSQQPVERVAVDPSGGDSELARRGLAALKLPARRLRRARQELAAAEQKVATCHESRAATEEEVRTRLAGQDEADLPAALERAGRLAAQLRRRVALDERLDEIARHQEELDQQSCELLEQQILPIGVLVFIGALFIVGVAMFISSFWFDNSVLGNFATAFSVLGFLVTIASGALKFLFERATATRLDSCRKQMDTLAQQALETKAERNAIDRELPQGVGSLTRRLQEAERELEALEQLLPLDSQRHSVARDMTAADQAVAAAKQERDESFSAWQRALADAGLPTDLAPGQVRDLAQQQPQSVAVQPRLDTGHDAFGLRHVEYEALSGRIRRLAMDLGITPEGDAASDLMRQILRQWDEQRPNVERRGKLVRRARQLRRQLPRLTRTLERLADSRHALLAEAGVYSQSEFRQLALQQAHARQLQRERDAVAAEIRTAIDGLISAADLAQLYDRDPHETLEARWEEATDRLAEIESSCNQCLKDLGALGQRQHDLAEGRHRGELQLELSTVEQRLQRAIDQWQVQSTTWLLLDDVRCEYERQRQPETLREASPYFKQLTQGRYVRVWTPLDQDVLYVEDDQQRRLPVDALSRGTREQLLLCLRLALVACYARRGVRLPVVLDDVMVNFDTVRAKAAARLLRDFAKAGHQLLLMTCHEHIWQIFRALRVDARRLPTAIGLAEPNELQPTSEPDEDWPLADEPDEEPASEMLLELDEVEDDEEVDEPDEVQEEEEDEVEEDDEEEELAAEQQVSAGADGLWEEVRDYTEQTGPVLMVLEEEDVEELEDEEEDAGGDGADEGLEEQETVTAQEPVEQPLREPVETGPPPPPTAAPQRVDNGQWVRMGPLVRRADAAAIPPPGVDM